MSRSEEFQIAMADYAERFMPTHGLFPQRTTNWRREAQIIKALRRAVELGRPLSASQIKEFQVDISASREL